MRQTHATEDLLDLRILRHLAAAGPTAVSRVVRDVTGQTQRLRHRCSVMVEDGRAAFVFGSQLTITPKGRLWLEGVRVVADPAAVKADAVHTLERRAGELQAEVEKLRGQLEDVTRLRDVHAGHLQDVAVALGPKFLSADCSFANAMQNLLRYVRSVEEEGGRYALLCQQAHDELDRAGVSTGGTPAERIRLLVAAHVTAMGHLTAERDQFRTAKFERDNEVHELEREIARRDREATRPAAPTEAPRSTELEQYLARELLAELEDNCDKSDPILRPLHMLRAIVTGEVPRG